MMRLIRTVCLSILAGLAFWPARLFSSENALQLEHPFDLNLLTIELEAKGDSSNIEPVKQISGLPVRGVIAAGTQRWLLVEDAANRLYAVLYLGDDLIQQKTREHTGCMSGSIEVVSDNQPGGWVSYGPLLCDRKL